MQWVLFIVCQHVIVFIIYNWNFTTTTTTTFIYLYNCLASSFFFSWNKKNFISFKGEKKFDFIFQIGLKKKTTTNLSVWIFRIEKNILLFAKNMANVWHCFVVIVVNAFPKFVQEIFCSHITGSHSFFILHIDICYESIKTPTIIRWAAEQIIKVVLPNRFVVLIKNNKKKKTQRMNG